MNDTKEPAGQSTVLKLKPKPQPEDVDSEENNFETWLRKEIERWKAKRK